MTDLPLLPTTLVGSYPQPGWLIDKEKLMAKGPPRVRMRDVWRVPEDELEAAQDDAVRLAVDDMTRAGIDIVTDGEVRRESYFNQFANALDGLDLDVTGGEQDNNMIVWKQMIDSRAVDIVQPDICYMGGITRTLEVADLARQAGIPCTLHSANLSLVTLFSIRAPLPI